MYARVPHMKKLTTASLTLSVQLIEHRTYLIRDLRSQFVTSSLSETSSWDRRRPRLPA